MQNLTLMPLGGVGETGSLNCMLYQTATTAFLVDSGLGFAGDRMPGVDLIIPDFSVLDSVADKLQALVLTHGHEDHVGSLPFLLRRFDLPVYATPFTRGIVRQKAEEAGLDVEIRNLQAGQSVTIGDVSIESIFLNHSIMDTVALLIKSQGSSVLHMTDFKIDHSAPDGHVTDLARLKKLGDEGLDLLMLDSTNVFQPGWTRSEMTVRSNLVEHFTRVKGRILACLFSSNMYRIQSLVECARLTGRTLAFTGRSTKEYTRIAREIKRLNLDDVDVRDVEEVHDLPDDKILLIVTGSQAEPRSVLNRISEGMFKPFKVREGDTLFMSSRMIPGNEGRIFAMMNRLALQGVTILDDSLQPIHASGHARQDELREVMRLTKPRFFMPIHGEYRHLVKHAEIAAEEGIPKERSVIILNGDCLEISANGAHVRDRQEVGRLLIAENGAEISEHSVHLRRKMAHNGMVAASVIFDQVNKCLIPQVKIDSYGLFDSDEEPIVCRELTAELVSKIQNSDDFDFGQIEKFLKVEIRHFYKQKYQIRPEVLVLINEI